MSTRSAIGYFTPSKKIRAVYCHWDGYPSNNGRILMEHYTDLDKIKELVALGDLSSLGKNIGSKKEEFYPGEGQRILDETYAYRRARDDKGTDAIEYDNAADYVSDMTEMNVEFCYLWNGTDWIVHDVLHSTPRGSYHDYPEFDFVEFILANEHDCA